MQNASPVTHARCGLKEIPPCGRVAPGSCLPRAPTDPDVRSYRIRLFRAWVRYGEAWECLIRGKGSGYRCRSRFMRSHVIRAFCERRSSHLRQVRTTL